MPTPAFDDLEDFLHRQDAGALADVLLELARNHQPVQERLARMRLANDPKRLAAEFKKTLSGWRRSRRYHEGQSARAHGRMLEAWLEQVARELQPADPGAALALFDAFIEADATWFAQADDSDGAIGDAVRAACRHWLQAAALCPAPRGGWALRLHKLYEADAYGAREALLREANLLLDEAALRALVASFEERLALALVAGSDARRLPMATFRHSAALTLLGQALRDPEVQVRATLRLSPNPNAVQREAMVRAFFEASQPAGALAWLEEPWGNSNSSRETLLAQALEQLGRLPESLPIRRRLFERAPSDDLLDNWLKYLPAPEHEAARAEARRIALEKEDCETTAAANLLLHLGDGAAAEARLIADAMRIDGRDYPGLGALAKELRAHGCPRGETAVYRALLKSILERAQSPAYSHAARYWRRLGEIADAGVDLSPLETHESFAAGIRQAHGRKPAFWAQVNGKSKNQ